MPPRGLQLLGEPSSDIRVHGRRRDEHGILGQRLDDAFLAEQNGVGLGGIEDHADDNLGLVSCLRRRVSALAAIGDKTRDQIGRDVAAGDRKAGALERNRHAKTHRAEPDYGDARFDGF
jgi:hypothetical protein